MTDRPHATIIAFVGLAGSGKTVAVERLAEHGIPKVTVTSTDEMLDEIDRLLTAGQHTLSVDSLSSLQQLRALQHAHPAAVTVVAILSSARHRLGRRPELSAGELTRRDWQQAEQSTVGAVITLADTYIINDETLDTYRAKIDALLE